MNEDYKPMKPKDFFDNIPSQATLDRPSIPVPEGLSREELRQFILERANTSEDSTSVSNKQEVDDLFVKIKDVENNHTDKSTCPKCGKDWLSHEFGVPAPFCP